MNELTWAALVPECSVADFNRSLSFYTDLLGFTVRHNRTDPAFAYLDLQGAQIMIEQLSDDSWTTGEMAAPHGRGINFQIEVSDLSPILKRLQAAKHELFQEVAEEWYEADGMLSGQREFLVQDPDGYLLRFAQYLGQKPLDD